MPEYVKHKIETASVANTSIQYVLSPDDMEDLNLIFESIGGNFPAGPQNASVEVSKDNVTFHTIDNANIALTAGQSKVAKYYNSANRGTTLALNPCAFAFVRVTIPALGASVQGKLTWSGQKRSW